MWRRIVQGAFGIALAFSVAFAVASCSDSNVETVQKDSASKTAAANPHGGSGAEATASAAGITWTVPESWKTGPERQMRIATYLIGDTQDADCAVFYFGPGQGGGIQANIDRWIGQFDQPDGSDSLEKAKIDKQTVSGLAVTTIDLTGSYNASMGGPMSGQRENRPAYRMLGAIIEAPEGPVFFKITGPEATVTTALDAFQELVGSAKTL